jgi:hypothetical protein
MTTIINLFAGPGAGKSTLAAGLFYRMKTLHIPCELVVEHAKELTYEGASMENHLAILAEQERRLRRLDGKVDFVITDSPLPLAMVYAKTHWTDPSFDELVWWAWGRYDNAIVRVKRRYPYQEYGRKQNETEAVRLDSEIGKLVKSCETRADAVAFEVDGNEQAVKRVLLWLGYGGGR